MFGLPPRPHWSRPAMGGVDTHCSGSPALLLDSADCSSNFSSQPNYYKHATSSHLIGQQPRCPGGGHRSSHTRHSSQLLLHPARVQFLVVALQDSVQSCLPDTVTRVSFQSWEAGCDGEQLSAINRRFLCGGFGSPPPPPKSACIIHLCVV